MRCGICSTPRQDWDTSSTSGRNLPPWKSHRIRKYSFSLKWIDKLTWSSESYFNGKFNVKLISCWTNEMCWNIKRSHLDLCAARLELRIASAWTNRSIVWLARVSNYRCKPIPDLITFYFIIEQRKNQFPIPYGCRFSLLTSSVQRCQAKSISHLCRQIYCSFVPSSSWICLMLKTFFNPSP